ncbi:MAG: hypothetical protein LAT64_09590 [Phycisphaerales bacterium]|nr:hypothetical protein [Planctomycetota bacterium]MCH8509000.1 hypothetical protein [Phycisphaerales bacterium]
MAPRGRIIPGLGLSCAAIAALAGDLAWAGEPERPSGAQRVVRVFDFEERDFNPLPVPFGWIRAQHDPSIPRLREGFPIWNRGGLDYETPAYSGIGSAVLPAEGGSASLRLLSGVISVFPGADYGITAQVRTEDMVHARAAIAARLLDQDGRVLPGTESRSDLVRTDGDWRPLGVHLAGTDERAAYLQIEMLVLQPRQWAPDEANPFHVWHEDYHARAWFDDLTVSLLPRMELDTGHHGHVIPARERPALNILVRDLTGDRIEAVVRVLDADGRPIDEHTMRPGMGRLVERFEPGLTRPGWYRAVLTVLSGGQPVGSTVLDFAWGAPEDEQRPRSTSFALRGSAVEPERARALPTMAAWTGVGRAEVGVWSHRLDRASADPDANPAFGAVRSMLDAGVEVTIALDEVPRDLAELVGRDPWDVPGVLAADDGLWLPWAERMLDQFGQGVLSWRLGRDAIESRGWRLGEQAGAASVSVARWVPGPELIGPWPVGVAVPAELSIPGRGLVVRDDGAGSDAALDWLVSSWAGLANTGARRVSGSDSDASTLTIEFPSSDDGRVSRAALGRLARRVITAWAAANRTGVSDRVRFSLDEAWRSTGGLRPSMMPTPELAAWRTLASVLGDRGAGGVDEIRLLPGVRILLTGEDDEGVLIAWLEDPEAPLRVLDLPLHPGPVRRVDLLGERRIIEPVEREDLGTSWHRIALSREPVIIEGVRADLVRFLAGVRLTPERLNPVMGGRRHALVIENPWDFPIRGRVFIVEPGGLSEGTAGRDRSWQIAPRVVAFSLDAGQRREEPIELSFGAGQETGWAEAIFDVQLFADEEYTLLRVPRRIEIASEDLDMEVVAYRAPGGRVSVHAVVTNRSDRPRSVELAAVAAGASRERATINGLNRGETGERRFMLEGVAPGARISVGLTEPDTGVRLTRTIDAP